MTIIFLNQFFWPDESATSLILTDCVREVARAGTTVHVVCSQVGYSGSERRPIDGLNQIKVHRVWTPRFARGTGITKIISYAAYFIGAAIHSARSRGNQIVSLTTPPLLPIIGRLAQLLFGSRHIIWEMDVYPDVAVELGVLRRGSLIERCIGWLADWPRLTADRIIVLGPCMKDRLIGRGISPERIVIAENWADGQAIKSHPFRANAKLKLLYSGNFGLAHEFATLSGAVSHFGKDTRFSFQFNGAGPRKRELEDFCSRREIRNCSFGAFQPVERLGEMLADCDVGLVTQDSRTSGTVVPSKVYAILAAGRPLLYIGPASASPAQMILESGCGWHIENGRVDELVRLLELLHSNFRLVEDAGRRARALFEQRYDLPIRVGRVLQVLGCASQEKSAPKFLTKS